MSRPWKRISPSTRADGTVSCIRLMHRSSVDLPHPDGPMIAVTRPVSTWNETSRTTRAAPKYASSDSIASATSGVVAAASPCTATGSASGRAAGCTPGALAARTEASAATGGIRTSRSIAAEPEARSGGEAGGEADDEDEREEDERACPGLSVPVVIGRNRIEINLHGKRGDRLERRDRPELVAERGEDERSGFAGDAGHGHQRAGDDPWQRGPQHDAERRAPLGVAQRQRGLAHRHRNEPN